MGANAHLAVRQGLAAHIDGKACSTHPKRRKEVLNPGCEFLGRQAAALRNAQSPLLDFRFQGDDLSGQILLGLFPGGKGSNPLLVTT